MKNNVFGQLQQNNPSYRDTFVRSSYPPLPEDVQGWNETLQELFCILSVAHIGEGMTVEDADAKAVRQVKESEDFGVRSGK